MRRRKEHLPFSGTVDALRKELLECRRKHDEDFGEKAKDADRRIGAAEEKAKTLGTELARKNSMLKGQTCSAVLMLVEVLSL